MKTALLAIIGILVLVVVLGGGCLYQGYNRAIQLDEEVKTKWAQVENQLQRRYELIPNLVETVKGVAGQEEKIFLGVAEARKAYFQAGTTAEKAEAASGLERALSRLLVLRETYPELKSNESFLKLQDSLEGTENRLSVERMRYNEAVQTLNTFTRQFPGSLFASFAGVGPAEYFEMDEAAKTAPKVDFSSIELPDHASSA
jgi:LemA protein